MSHLLPQIQSPADLHKFTDVELTQLAEHPVPSAAEVEHKTRRGQPGAATRLSDEMRVGAQSPAACSCLHTGRAHQPVSPVSPAHSDKRAVLYTTPPFFTFCRVAAPMREKPRVNPCAWVSAHGPRG